MTERNGSSAWFVGEGSLLIQAANIWLELGQSIAGIASAEPSIVAWAAEHGVQCVPFRELCLRAGASPFDYLFSVVNLVVLPEQAISLPQKLAINFHDGYLPRYAGVNVPVWALLRGETTHGVTWHIMTPGADEGDILVQRAFEIAADETAFSLNAKCFTAGIETYRELAERITTGTLAPMPQNLAERNYFGFYDRPDSVVGLAFDAAAEEIARIVRALDFGTYPNPVGTAKLVHGAEAILVSEATVMENRSGSPPGTILAVEPEGLVVATATTDIRLSRLRSASGEALDRDALLSIGLHEGLVIPSLDAETRAALTRAYVDSARHEGHFLRQLATAKPLGLSLGSGSDAAPTRRETVPVNVPAGVERARLAAAFLAFAARKSGTGAFDVAYADSALRARSGAAPALFATEVPLGVAVTPETSLAQAIERLDAARVKTSSRHPPAKDLFARQPQLPKDPLPVELLVDVPLTSNLPLGELAVLVDTREGTIRLVSRTDRAERAALERLARRFELFLQALPQGAEVPLGRVPLLSPEEEQRISSWNETARSVPEHETVHTLFAAQAQRTPDRVAVTARGQSLTYRELDRRANAVAHGLRELGVGPDALVGIYVDRSVDMVVALLGIHKAGGAYVPLDPSYPAERITFMIEDSRLSAVVTEQRRQSSLPGGSFSRLLVDDPRFAEGAESGPENTTGSAHLAYVIYTSGSTGKPKGVLVEHRNVVNFLCAMDDVLDANGSGTWLAVTSLSFDISVLELIWSLTRGLSVVLYAGDGNAGALPRKPLDFGVFYFASAAHGGADDYQLLLEGARFADENGFNAVWTPERHFHAFGGLYPNPAVTNAALAMITKRVRLRAGSCVSPLHSPLRIAEEWAFVDNLSNGRVDISFAAGWQPNDFALRPEAFPKRKEQMFEDIETVRRLWRGESVAFKNGLGKEVSLSTLPRPIQKDLPVWITAAGSPETFEAAGRVGANLLTHLLGQSFAELAEKIRIYRSAREKAGHPGRGVVTLMLHTFIGPNEEMVKAAVRDPMKGYLKSAVGLIKEAAWTFPTFRTSIDQGTFSPDQLSPEEMDGLLDHAFERYYKTSGLFGTVESALEVVEEVRRVDADEIACLIDFGVPEKQVLAHLPFLAQVRERANQGTHTASSAGGETIAELFAAHPVTHFQCTPSMASMLTVDDASRAGLSRLSYMLVGGEALPLSLARDLKQLVKGRLINVYGPTETTVWSTSHVLGEIGDEIPIGRPLANTDVLILDASGAPAAPGEQGELAIGGKGVTRGYLGREELTRERFVPHPQKAGQRVYRTGDLAAFREDGVLRFFGRLDHQVKIRGYRIEIGEIEARLAEHASVRECVVVAREDSPGDKRLVGYVVPRALTPDADELRRHLLARLPEYMVPSAFVSLPALPQTPNRKVDRKALPAPERQVAPPGPKVDETPHNGLEETILGIWRELLNRNDVGLTDNFFDLGGHSLLTIQVLGKLKPKVSRPLSLVDLFRYPTIRSLAAFLEAAPNDGTELEGSATRGAERQRIRRAMMDRRKR